jgi:hypothetical protein
MRLNSCCLLLASQSRSFRLETPVLAIVLIADTSGAVMVRRARSDSTSHKVQV